MLRSEGASIMKRKAKANYRLIVLRLADLALFKRRNIRIHSSPYWKTKQRRKLVKSPGNKSVGRIMSPCEAERNWIWICEGANRCVYGRGNTAAEGSTATADRLVMTSSGNACSQDTTERESHNTTRRRKLTISPTNQHAQLLW